MDQWVTLKRKCKISQEKKWKTACQHNVAKAVVNKEANRKTYIMRRTMWNHIKNKESRQEWSTRWKETGIEKKSVENKKAMKISVKPNFCKYKQNQ